MSSCAVMMEIVMSSSESTKFAGRGIPPGPVDYYVGVDQVPGHYTLRLCYPRGLSRNVFT
jgi:hypothetical protein